MAGFNETSLYMGKGENKKVVKPTQGADLTLKAAMESNDLIRKIKNQMRVRNPKVEILCGIPGSGRNEYAAHLIKEDADKHTIGVVSNDDVMVDAEGNYKFDKEKVFLSVSLGKILFFNYIASGNYEKVLLNNNNISIRAISTAMDCARFFSNEVMIVKFDVAHLDKEKVWANAQKWYPELTREKWDMQYEGYKGLTIPEAMHVRTLQYEE